MLMDSTNFLMLKRTRKVIFLIKTSASSIVCVKLFVICVCGLFSNSVVLFYPRHIYFGQRLYG